MKKADIKQSQAEAVPAEASYQSGEIRVATVGDRREEEALFLIERAA